jgi:divalent metal cation (Fe/Co/Zn/Cd) transporter
VEKCRIRKSGMSYFVDIHVEVDVRRRCEGHEIGGRVRSELRTSSYASPMPLSHRAALGG